MWERWLLAPKHVPVIHFPLSFTGGLSSGLMRLQGVEGGEDAGVVWQRVFKLEAALAAGGPTSSPRSADQAHEADADQVQLHHRRAAHWAQHVACSHLQAHHACGINKTEPVSPYSTVLGRTAGGEHAWKWRTCSAHAIKLAQQSTPRPHDGGMNAAAIAMKRSDAGYFMSTFLDSRTAACRTWVAALLQATSARARQLAWRHRRSAAALPGLPQLPQASARERPAHQARLRRPRRGPAARAPQRAGGPGSRTR